ncbi:hypothetical protein RFI_28104, partial [Reticulomyxa filosa]
MSDESQLVDAPEQMMESEPSPAAQEPTNCSQEVASCSAEPERNGKVKKKRTQKKDQVKYEGSGSNFKTGIVKITESTQSRRQAIIDLASSGRTAVDIQPAPMYDVESITKRSIGVIDEVDKGLFKDDNNRENYIKLVKDLCAFHVTTALDWNKKIKILCKEHKLNFFPKKPALRKTYILMRLNGILEEKNDELEQFLVTKAMRSQSGVLVIT